MRVLKNCIILACLVTTAPLLARAGLVDDVPSCYSSFHLAIPQHTYTKLVYLLIDQTTLLDHGLEKSMISNINRIIQPGTKVVAEKFSAFSQGRYLQVIHTAIVEMPPPESRYGDVPLAGVSMIKNCFVDQQAYVIKLIDHTVMKVMKSSSFSLAHSNIINTLKSVSKVILQSTAQHKVLILVSDGLENSTLMTFYARHTVREFSPQRELKKVRKAGLFGNFGGARVYVIGGAMIPPAKYGSPTQRQAYHSPVVLRDLRAFWGGYFRASNAELIEFGEPTLLEPVSYD